MNSRSLLVLPFFSLSLSLSSVACSDSVSSSSPTGDAGPEPATDAGGDGSVNGTTLGFKPTNLKLDGIDTSKLGDFVVDRANCAIETESQLADCGDMDAVAFTIVDQPGAGKIGVYIAKNVRIEPNASLKTRGTFALAIVALDTMDIRGGVDVGASTSYPSAGGFVHPAKEESKGGGEGGGGAGSATNAGGGGGFCGIGGKGVAKAGGTPAAGGIAYGTPALSPLLGGSAGGSGALLDSGTGGGAVQLVAGKTFSLAVTGYVSAGGGGGSFVGAAASQHGSGGGSGGAILIEAPTVNLLGTLAANGGAGGSKDYGQDGKTDGSQALGDTQTNGSKGGAGSDQGSENGNDGTLVDGDGAPGGGGGGGRIRVNSETGNSALSAKLLSPSANGPCTTEGTLTK